LGLIVACLVAEAAVLRVGIDDLDEGYFVQQALRVLGGQVPYRDFQSLYTPGLAYVHATLFGLVGGPFLLAPRVLALAARAAQALLLFGLARPLVRRPLWAAVPGVFMLIGLDDAPVRWEPHPGWLSTLFAVLAAWCLSQRPTTRWLVAAGIAAGMAYVFKQNTGAFMLAAIVVYGAVAPAHRGKRIVIPVVAFAAVTLLWLVPLLIALGGDVSPLGLLIGAVNQAGLFSAPDWPVLVPIACLAGGLWLWRRDHDQRLRWYLIAGTALLLTQYPRMDALHLVWSAPLLLVVGAVTLDRLRPLWAGLIVLSAFALTWPTITSRLGAIQQLNVTIEDVHYAAGIEVPERTRQDLEAVVTEIQARTAPNEPIFVYPTSPLLYALSDRSNPTRFDHLNPGAASAEQIAHVIADLEASGVHLVVISDFWEAAWGDPGPNTVLETWLAAHFTDVARYGGYRVLTSGL
jgi:4-amino-4-deoxy-L-arabinose transferase-like glycosyltransferase